MDSISEENRLPADMWARVARSLPVRDKASLGRADKSCAEGVRRSWRADDYFEAAGQPGKPERLRVAHGPAAPGDTKAWRALTRDMHRVGTLPCVGELLPLRPEKALMALARAGIESWRDNETELWASYAQALLGAFRSAEAARFEERIKVARHLTEALSSGDLCTVKALLALGILLPDADTLARVIDAHPSFANIIVVSLLSKGLDDKVCSLFVAGTHDVREVLYACDALSDPRWPAELFSAAVRARSRDAMAYLFLRGSYEEIAQFMLFGSGEGVEVSASHIARLIGLPHRDAILTRVLPIWREMGGDPTRVLEVHPCSRELTDILVVHGACPERALRNITAEQYADWGHDDDASVTVNALLAYGARLTRDEFNVYIKKNREFLRGGYGGFRRMLRTFEQNNAVPLRDGRFTNRYVSHNLPAWF